MKYTKADKQYFFSVLEQYKNARKQIGRKGNNDYVIASLKIYSALALVPKSYKRYVTKVEKEIS